MSTMPSGSTQTPPLMSFDLDFFPARPGLTLSNGRYKVLRKLGAGIWSSTWLVADSESELPGYKYRAVKILTVDATTRHHAGEIRELEFLQAIQTLDDSNSLPVLRDHFEEQGPRGSHLCIVMDILGSSVASFRRSAPQKALPVYMVRNIISMTVEALVQLHELDIVHTDVKPDNILFNIDSSDQGIERYLELHPISIEGEFELDGERYPIPECQPIPHKFLWNSNAHEAERMSVSLVDLGQAQWAGKQPTVNQFSAFSLRAPEVLLWSDFGPKVDIWAVGCITFELLVGRWLFHPEEGGEDWRLEDDHLAKMMELTSERFKPEMLERSQFRKEYFDDEGNLLRIKELIPVSVEEAMSNYNVLSKEEIGPAADFIRACLHLDYKDRASAKELEVHPWLLKAFSC